MNGLFSGMEWLPDQPGSGGLPRYFHGMIEALPATGMSGTALVSYLADSSRARNDIEDTPMRVLPMADQDASLIKRWRGANDAAQVCFHSGVDLVNAHFALYALPFIRRMPADMPLVVHFHGPWADEVAAENSPLRGRIKRAVARRIELTVYRRATLLVTLSEAFAKILRERYDIPAERIRIVPGGVNLRPFLAAPARSQAREKLGWPTDRPIMLTVRRLVRRMGLEMLIDSMSQIRKRCPDALLMIGGKGSLSGELQRRVDDAKLNDHVRLLGLVPEADLPFAYAAADLSIVPTVSLEGFGLVTAESLGSGTPVIGTPIGGTPEILRGLDPALVLDASTETAIADRAAAALRGEIRLPSRLRCRAHASQYDWRDVAPRLRSVYDQAVLASNV